MKVFINLSRLLEEGKITPSEFERFVSLANNKEGIPNFFSDLTIGFGLVSICCGIMGLYIDLEMPDYMMPLEGIISIGLGCFLIRFRSDLILLAMICFVFGARMIVSIISETLGRFFIDMEVSAILLLGQLLGIGMG